MRPGNGNPRPLRRILYFQDKDLDPLGSLEHLAAHLLRLRKDGVHLSKVDAHVPADIPLHDAGNDLLLLAEPLVELGLPALLADFLENHVLCVLGCDPAEVVGVNGNLDDVANLEFRIPHPGVRNADL